MTEIIDIPQSLIGSWKSQNVWIDSPSTSAGSGQDGRSQIVFSEQRRWSGEITFVTLVGQKIMAARAIGSRLRGRVNILRLPVCNAGTPRFLGDVEAYYRSLGVSAEDIAAGSLTFSDSARFSDGSCFALPDYAEPTVVSAALVGASEIRLSGYLGRNMTIGARFSIDDFLYEVAEKNGDQIKFNPPLRQAASAGAAVQVSRPFIKVRLATDADWRLFVDYGKLGKPMTVNVVEVFER